MKASDRRHGLPSSESTWKARLPGLLDGRLDAGPLVAGDGPVHEPQIQVPQLQVLERALSRLLHLGRRMVRVVQLRMAAIKIMRILLTTCDGVDAKGCELRQYAVAVRVADPATTR